MIRMFFSLLAWLSLAAAAAAMVGGAEPAAGIARAAVMIVGDRGNFCTGTAIARDLVLTAAHCVAGAADYKLIELEAGGGVKLREIASVTRHPQFSAQSFAAHRATADVALLKLAAPLPHAAPAPLMGARPPFKVGERFLVAGFGVAERGNGKTSGVLRAAWLEATGKPGNLQLRLHDPAAPAPRIGLGACTGDSGAPVFQDDGGRRAVIGVVSWSTGPNNEEGCGGLTGVTPLMLYRGWIIETAKKLGSALAP